MQSIESVVDKIRSLNAAVLPGEAESVAVSLISGLSNADLIHHEAAIWDALCTFLPKRKRKLTDAFEARLTEARKLASLMPGPGVQLKPTPAVARPAQPIVASPAPPVLLKDPVDDIEHLRALGHSFTEALRELAEYHIFQWATFYRDVLMDYSLRFLETLQTTQRPAKLRSMISEVLAHHSEDIFIRGFRHQVDRLEDTQYAVLKSLRGLQRFLDLPIEFYSVNLRSAHSREQANALRSLLSTMLSAILQGYCRVEFDQQGSGILPRFPRSWAYVLPFMEDRDFSEVVALIQAGDFRDGVLDSVKPLVQALDVLTHRDAKPQSLPALSQLVWPHRRLDVTLYSPPDMSQSKPAEIQCFLDRTFTRRTNLDEAAARGVKLVLAPLRPDLMAMVGSDERLAQIVVNTIDNVSATSLCGQAVDLLDAGTNASNGGVPVASRTLQINFAKNFPLERPSLATYFHVYRSSVRDLMRAFERRTGVRLWCSVRRSGKTTAAALDLETTSGRSVVVPQTCDDTGVMADGGLFYLKVLGALEDGRQLPSDFLIRTVEQCSVGKNPAGERFVFVIDEYETLFGRLATALRRDRDSRYTVVQPLLDQMVAFAGENLLVLLGQQPNAHYVLMDQNQLSPYVEQDPFPLFEHDPTSLRGEFCELLRRVLSDHVEFDMGFANAIYDETGGHPYLTVNILSDFCDYLIECERPISSLRFTAEDFLSFSAARLQPARLRVGREYDFFRHAASHALSADARSESPWLHAMYECLRQIALNSPDTFSCTERDFEQISQRIADETDLAPYEILETGIRANFFDLDNSVVRPRVRVLSRVAAAVRGRVTP